MIFRLIILTGPQAGRQITVEKKPMIIGSGQDCSISVDDAEIAAKHASIEHSDKGLFIRDLGSMHKILVNQHEVAESRLKHGDEIEIGRTRFLVQAIVKAEVDGSENPARPPMKKMSRTAMLLSSLAVLLVAASPFLWVLYVSHVESVVPPEDGESYGNIPMNLATSVAVEAESPASAQVSNQVGTAEPRSQLAGPQDSLSVSNELQKMREDLTGIRELVEKLVVKQDGTTVAENGTPSDEVAAATPDESAAVAATSEPEAQDEAITKKTESTTTETAVAPKPAPGLPAGSIKMVSLEQSKFPNSEDYEEMRALNVEMQLATDASVDAEKVRVKVGFYDRNTDTGEIAPARAAVPMDKLKVYGDWQGGERKSVTATYLIPRKAQGVKPTVRTDKFYGFVVRVYYADKIQDQVSRPTDLAHYVTGKLD